ncbi:hypothetical protein MAH1_24340 [Sessilibacter sp. MAH1]
MEGLTLTMMDAYLDLNLNISPVELQKLYTSGGQAPVIATATDGRKVQFPAAFLKPWLTHSGIHGQFRLYFDQNNRMKHVQKLS